jgi:hypothetical protein
MPRSLEDLDASRSKAFAKGGGQTTPLTMSEQILHGKAQTVLDRLERAKRDGDPVAIAKAKLNAERVQAELQATNSARGSLTEVRSALSRAMTHVTVR